jgi:cell division protein FtsI (penicillin-binding protein 3)
MKEPAGKTGKKIPAILLGALIFTGCLTFLAPSIRGYFFKGPGGESESSQRLAGSVPGKSAGGRYRIFDRRYGDLAISFKMNSLYARPLEIIDLQSTARILAEDLDLEEKRLVRDLRSERSFVWLGRRLPKSGTAKIMEKKIGGIYSVEEPQRFYPGGRSAAHVLGFIENDAGLAGIEFEYDAILGGGQGGIDLEGTYPTGHLVLTLDLKVQTLLEEQLAELMEQTGSSSAIGVLMDYRSGAVLALANLPGYDPNYYWDSKEAILINKVVDNEVDYRGWQKMLGFVSAYERKLGDSQDQMEAVRMGLQLTGQAANSNRASQQWFSQDGNQWLSPELIAWPEVTVAADRNIDELLTRLGSFGVSGVDLPESDPKSKSKMTPLKFLKAFAAMINGGVKITPHLGAAVIDPRSGIVAKIDHGNMLGVLDREASEKTVKFLKGVSRSPGESIFLERLEPEIIESGEKRPDQAVDEERTNRFRAEMLGFTAERNKGLTMMISLTGASIDPGRKSPIRSTGEEILDQAALLAAEEVARPDQSVLVKREKELYTEWLQASGRRIVSEKGVEVEKRTTMPDLRGLSIRKALRNLEDMGLKLKIVGSGRVVAQLPPVGSHINAGSECVLTLQSDN